MFRITLTVFAFLCYAAKSTSAQSVEPVTPLPAAHAHNDYLHKRPLLDALEQGFCSVEADIFLQEGELRVAHNSWQTRPGVTLEELYLKPLQQRVTRNGGTVYPKSSAEFTLLIDIKHDGPKVFAALHRKLAEYSGILSSVENDRYTRRAITVVISGDRPKAEIAATNPRWCGIDGRLSDLDSEDSAHLLPLISDRWSSHFTWRGKGRMPMEERQKLAKIVRRAHEAGRRVRFWATPENTVLWNELLKANVDLLNTDDLPGMQKFLSSVEE